MSSIDNRIVQMQFENSQFEKGVSQSLKTLEDLKKGLDLKDSGKSLEALQKAGNSFSLAKMANGIEQVTQKFSAMGIIGKRILENIADTAYRTGTRLVKSLTIDQLSSGWSKYEQKTKAVQQIVNATGLSIGDVDKELEKLIWFSDETSYSFTDMVSNIGKFTSMNIPLDKSVTAMQGISTWAALSGAGVQEASRAMYNLSQAIGLGSVKMQDWKSIALANMATAEFKQTAIDTAVAMGKLKKGAVTLNTFESTLSKGWFTSEVLLEVLGKYGDVAGEVYKVSEENGISAAQAMEMMGDKMDTLGGKAFKAAQEARTFTDAIEATKDAVSSNWMSIFENVFGNYEEAKVLWTDLANYLWDIFASPLSATNDVFKEWKELGGREKMLRGIYDIFVALRNVITAVGEALGEIFPPLTVDRLMSVSEAVENFGSNLRKSLRIWEFEYDVPYIEEADKIGRLLDENTFKLGDQSDAVRELQQALVEAGLMEEKFAKSGKYNVFTDKAVEKYKAGLSGVTKEFEKLDNTFKFGDKGKEVEEFQKKLKELGQDPGDIDGIYGKKTQAAYEKYLATIKDVDKERKELKKGQKGEDVKELQEKLIQAGMLDKGQADGIFGPKTEAALKKYQEAKGLTASGILDKDTIAVMFGEETTTSIQKAVHSWVEYSNTLERLKNVAKGVFSIFSIALTVFKGIGAIAFTLLRPFAPLLDSVLTILSGFGLALSDLDAKLKGSEKFGKFIEGLNTTLEPVHKWAQSAGDALVRFFGFGDSAEEANGDFITFKSIYDSTKKSIKDSGVIDKVKDAWASFKETLDKIKGPIKNTFGSIKEWVGGKFTSLANAIPGIVTSITTAIGNFAAGALNKLSGAIPKIQQFFKRFKLLWGYFKNSKTFKNAAATFTKAFDGLKNAFKSLKGPAGDAWKSIKESLGEKFKKIADSLPGIISKVTLSIVDFATKAVNKITEFVQKIPGYVSKVKDFFKAFFSSGDENTGKKQGFGSKIGEFLKSIPSTISNFVQKIPGYARRVGSVLKELWDSLKVSEKMQTLGPKLTSAWQAIKEFFSKLAEAIKTFFTTDTSDKETFGEKIKAKLGGFTELGEWISTKWTSLLEKLGTSWEGIKEFFTKLWGYVKDYGKWVLIGAAFISVIVLIGRISGAFKKLKEVIGSFKQKTQPMSKSILQVAAAIALIAGSIWLIGQLNADQFKRGAGTIAAITVAIGLLMGLAAVFLKGDAGKAVKNLGSAVKNFAIGIAVLAGSIIILSVIPTKNIINGGLKLIGIAAVLVVMMATLNKVGATKFNYKGLWQIGAIIAILAIVAARLGKMNIWRLLQGVLGLSLVMGTLAGLMYIMGKFRAKEVKIKGFIGLAAAVAVLGIVAARLGKMKIGNLAKGIGSLVVIMGMITIITDLFGKYSKTFNVAPVITMFLGIAAVIAIFGLVVNKIKNVDPTVMLSFSGSLAIALAAFVAACMIVGKANGGRDMLEGAGGIAGSIAMFAVVIGGIVWALGKLDQASPGVFDSGTAVLNSIATALSPFFSSFENCAGIVGVFLASWLVGKTNSGWDMFSGAVSIAATLFVLVGAIGVLAVGLGYLDTLGDGSELSSAAERGGKVLGAISEALGKLDLGVLIPIGAALLIATLFAKISSPSLKMIGKASAIAAAFDAIVIIVGGLITALGALNDISDNELVNLIDSGGSVLESISNALSKLDLSVLVGIAAMLVAATILGATGAASLQIVGGAAVIGLAFDALVVAVTGVVAALGALDQITGGGLVKAIDSGGAVLETLSRALGRVRTGFEQAYNESMVQFAESMHTVVSNIGGTSDNSELDSDIEKALEIAGKIHNFFLGLETNKMDQTSVLNYNTAAEGLTDNLANFGNAIGDFKTGVSGLTSNESIIEDTDLAIKIATSVKKFFDDIAAQTPDGSGLKEYVEKVSSTVINVGRFGISMALLRIGITGVAKSTLADDTPAAIEAAQSVADFLSDIKDIDIETNKSALDAWLTGDTKGNTVLDTIVKLGGAIQTARNSFSGIGATGDSFSDDITAAVNAMKSVGEMLNYFSSGEVYIPDPDVENGQYAQNFIAALNSIDWIANKIGDFDIATKNHDVAGVSAAIQAFADLASVLSGLGETKISTDNFLGDLDATAVVEKLSTFTSSLTTSLSDSTTAITDQSTAFNSAGNTLAAAVSSGMSEATIDTSKLESSISDSVAAIRAYHTDFQTAGKYLDQGLTNGIAFNAYLALSSARLMAQQVVNVVKSVFAQASPSKVFAEIGKYNDMGLAKGMTQYSSVVTKSAEGVGTATIETARSSLSQLSSILADDIDDTPVVRPVVDLTNAREAANSIGGMFHNQSFGVETSTNLATRASNANSARLAAKQGTVQSSSSGTVNSTNSAVNLSGNNFYIRSEQDVQSLASEIATLSKQQQRSYGAVV